LRFSCRDYIFFYYRKVRSKGYVSEAYRQEPDYHKRSRSDAELISKIVGGLQELEETVFWLELPVDSDIIKAEQMAELMKEADELIAILVSIAKTVKIRKNRK